MSDTGKNSGQSLAVSVSFDEGVTYLPFGAVTTKNRSLAIANTDVTDDNSNRWNEFLETLRNETISFSGFTDRRSGAEQGPIIDRLDAFSYSPAAEGKTESKLFIRLERPNSSAGILRTSGCYQITSWSNEGAVDGAIGYSFEATSTGVITAVNV